MWLVVGLGNPGPEYERNRHNVGFMVVDRLGGRHGRGARRAKYGAEILDASIGNERLLLCKPMEFMNVSGQAVGNVARFHKILPDRVIVVHDELDLPFGRMKLGAGGGHGGHNGLKSILAHLGTPDFARVRIGIGRPSAGREASDHVLADFSRAEMAQLGVHVEVAADAVETIVGEGLIAAMNKFNRKDAAPGGAA